LGPSVEIRHLDATEGGDWEEEERGECAAASFVSVYIGRRIQEEELWKKIKRRERIIPNKKSPSPKTHHRKSTGEQEKKKKTNLIKRLNQ